MSEEKSVEEICLEGVKEFNLTPMYQITIFGCNLCLAIANVSMRLLISKSNLNSINNCFYYSFQQAPGEKGKSTPDCQYCSNIIVYVEKSDVLDGWYNKCKFRGEKNEENKKKEEKDL